MNAYFKIYRFKNLLVKELNSSLKGILLIIGAMFSIFTISVILYFSFGKRIEGDLTLQTFHNWVFIVMLFAGGAFVTSLSFLEIRSKNRAHFYLLTPGSSMEKFFVNLLISLFGYLVFMILVFLIYSVLFNWITGTFYDTQFGQFNILDKNVLKAMQVFVFVQSVFLLGSISFKKYPVILTPIVVFALNVALVGFTKLVKILMFGKTIVENQIINEDVENLLSSYGEILVLYILPLILWYVAYLKLKEKEY